MEVQLSLDTFYNHVKRKRLNIQNWLIAVGGISRGLFVACLIASQSVARQLFRGAII